MSNPSTDNVRQISRDGRQLGTPWRTLGPAITAPQAAPTQVVQCVAPARAQTLEFCVVCPAGVTATLVYGRWVSAGTVDQFVPTGSEVIVGSGIVLVRTGTDPVGAYIGAIAGSLGSESIQLLHRQTNDPAPA